MSSRRFVDSGSASGCKSEVAPVGLQREVKEDYVTVASLLGSSSGAGRPDLKPIDFTFRETAWFDVKSGTTVYNKTVGPADDTMFSELNKLYDEISLDGVDVVLDGRDMLKNMDAVTPSTSANLVSSVFGASTIQTNMPSAAQYIFDRTRSKILTWSSARPVETYHIPAKGWTYVATGLPVAPTCVERGRSWYPMALISANGSNLMVANLMLGFDASTQAFATTHNWITLWITYRCHLRQRRGTA